MARSLPKALADGTHAYVVVMPSVSAALGRAPALQKRSPPHTLFRHRSHRLPMGAGGQGADLAALACDETDYKGLIARAKDTAEKLALAQRLATRRLASGVVPELDACFAALALEPALA